NIYIYVWFNLMLKLNYLSLFAFVSDAISLIQNCPQPRMPVSHKDSLLGYLMNLGLVIVQFNWPTASSLLPTIPKQSEWQINIGPPSLSE
ncbi:polyprotein, partial [Schistosoma japonicum]